MFLSLCKLGKIAYGFLTRRWNLDSGSLGCKWKINADSPLRFIGLALAKDQKGTMPLIWLFL